MSPSLLAILLRAERMTVRSAAFSRRWYRKTGMTRRQVAYYGNRRAWPDACQLVRREGADPYRPHGAGKSDRQATVDELLAELREAQRELDNLRTIVGEVMAEKDPREFDYRIESAAEDVERALKFATEYAEEL